MVFYLSKSYEISMDEKKREEMKLLIVKLERYLAVMIRQMPMDFSSFFVGITTDTSGIYFSHLQIFLKSTA